MSRHSLDVIIIGAGAAGLAAARHARRLGLRWQLLEASHRLGGRAYTDHATLGYPVDRGCHWLHSADQNPLRRLADRVGFSYHTGPPHFILHRHGQWDAGGMAACEDYFRRCWQAVAAAGTAGRDVAFTDVVPHDREWWPMFDFWCGNLHGQGPEASSTLDYARYRETAHNYPVREGYGRLVQRLGIGLTVHRHAPVERIRWHRQGVTVDTPQGSLQAQAAVVTVSTGVLAAERLRFSPALPMGVQEAIHALPLGAANKIMFRVRQGAMDVSPFTYAQVYSTQGETLNFQLRPFARPLALGYIGGRFSTALESAGRAAMLDYGLSQLRTLFGNAIDREILAHDTTRWETDPRFLGGYSVARPGQAHARERLAKPLGPLYFAGEATSITAYGTAHGAYQEGIRAVAAIAQRLWRHR